MAPQQGTSHACDRCGRQAEDLYVVEDTRDWDGDGPYADALVCGTCLS